MELKHIVLVFALILSMQASAQQTQSTIDPNVPVPGTLVEQSGPQFRANWQRAINDINALFAGGAAVPPTMPGNTVFGRNGASAGPGASIPFSTLGTLIPGLSPASHLSFYGAACNGTTNDDAAISAWLAATVAVGKPAYFSGTCAFNTPIVLPIVNGVSIIGDSPATSVLLYTGANTTSDIISIGNSATVCCSGQQNGLHFQNWQLKSNTNMTGGAAMHFQQTVRSALINWSACDQDCPNNFFHGVWFDQIDVMRWCGISAKAKQDVIRVNGHSAQAGADLFLDCGGKITGGAVGVHIGGTFGGFFCNSVDVIANNTNILIDNTIDPGANLQIFINQLCPLDTPTTTNLRLSDTVGTLTTSWLAINGGWLASTGSGDCFVIDANVNWPIQFNGGTIINCHGNGITNNSTKVRFIISGTRIVNNTGRGLQSVAQDPGLFMFASADFENNTGGNFSTGTNIFIGQSCSGTPTGAFASQFGYVTQC
jgi:hypothetical protein